MVFMASASHPIATPTAPAGPGYRLQIDSLVILLALIATLLVAGLLWHRSHSPSAGFLAEPSSKGAPPGWRITEISPEASESGLPREWLGATLVRACAIASEANPEPRCVNLQPQWMMDSPIALPSASAIAQFITGQQALLDLASKAGERVELHALRPNADTEVRAIITLHNSREYLNERFALVLIAAVMIYLVGCSMLAFVRRSSEVWWAFGMCAGFFLFMLMRGWYTNRTWAQPELGWWLVISWFRVGVMLCGCASVIALWNVRLRVRRQWPLAVCALICAVVALHAFGLIESAFWGYRFVTLGLLVLIVGIGVASWWLGYRGDEGERLRARTFGRILAIGFLPVIITNPLWAFRPDLSQIAYLQNLAVGLAGVPVIIIVAQSAQYQLHEFWWRLWLVLVAAVLALVGAAIIVVFSGISAVLSLIIMTTLAALTIYFLRGWLEKRLIGKPPVLEGFLPQVMQLQALNGDEFDRSWRRLLQDAFAPKEFHAIGDTAQIELTEQGNGMHLPAIGSSPALALKGAASFTRSFSHADARLAQSLHALVAQGLAARSSFVAGAVQERQRIAADLHDDIGGKLLHLANTGGAEGQYARNTLEDLRTITRGLSAQPRLLPELLADLQYQLGQRAERGGIDLRFATLLPPDQATIQIGSRQSTVLASICSELLRNAMQHRGVRHIEFDVKLEAGQLILRCHNDGDATDPAQWKHGLGTTSIRRRVNDLQGQCDWLASAGGGVSFKASWPLAAWLSADTGAFMAQDLR
jgi:signal transduction histidine kinase